MAKKPVKTEFIDFENLDGSAVDPILLALDARALLYRINNPYVGNKRKIVVDIAHAMDKRDYKFSTVLDLFSGSGMVSLFFKLLGKKVTSNDLLTSSYYNALVFVENSELLLSQDTICHLGITNPNASDFVQKNYATRFTPREAQFLDNYRANLDLEAHFGTPGFAAGIVTMEHYVMSHCFLGGRLNNGQILAKLDHRLNHDRNFSSSPAETLEMTFNLDVLPHFAGPTGKALNLDCLDALKQSGEQEMVYIDPPYGQSQSDYASMFAFCEEYIYGQKIEELPHLKTSKKFVSSKDYDVHFKELLDCARHIPQWAISYNDSSWSGIDYIKSVVSNFRKSVEVINIDYEYKYRKNSSGTEYLILAR